MRTVLSLVIAVLIAAPVCAADKEKKERKKPNPAASILKRLEKAELTDEQVAKVKDVAAKIAEKRAEIMKATAMTPEQKKARSEAMKKAKAEGKSPKEAMEAVKAAVKLTPEQQKAMDEARACAAAMMKEVMALLTDEQKAKLGTRKPGVKKPGKKAGEKKGPRKKKPAAEE
jgi:hypothetical protein